MRKYTIIYLVLAIMCGSALFYVSQKTRDAREEIAIVNKNIEQEKESIRVLKAEWSYLNRPQRLERLAKKYLDIGKTNPNQFIALGEVDPAKSFIIKEQLEEKKTMPVDVASMHHTGHKEAATTKDETKVAVVKRMFKQIVEDTIGAVSDNLPESKEEDVADNRREHVFKRMISLWGNE